MVCLLGTVTWPYTLAALPNLLAPARVYFPLSPRGIDLPIAPEFGTSSGPTAAGLISSTDPWVRMILCWIPVARSALYAYLFIGWKGIYLIRFVGWCSPIIICEPMSAALRFFCLMLPFWEPDAFLLSLEVSFDPLVFWEPAFRVLICLG